jgi:hypothetical protein
MAAGGSGEQRLIKSSNLQYPNDWSRDGRFVLYTEVVPGTAADLWILPVTPDGKPAPDAKPRPYLRTQFSETYGRFSPQPEPQWVAYVSDESGRNEIYVDAFPEPRNRVRISTGGGTSPEWSPDSRELFYLTPDSKLMQVSLKRVADSIEPSSPGELFALPIAYDGLSPYGVAPEWPEISGPRHPGKTSRPSPDPDRQLACVIEEGGGGPITRQLKARLIGAWRQAFP